MRELYLLPDENRRLFTGIDTHTTPSVNFAKSLEIEAASRGERETHSVEGWLPSGSSTVQLAFANDYSEGTTDTDRNIRLDRLDVRDAAGRVVVSYELETLPEAGECNGPDDGHHYAFHCNGSVDVVINAPTAGQHTIEIVAWADQAGDELARLDVTVLDATHSGGGAEAIRGKLVELFDKLLGVEVTPFSPDVDAAFELFAEVMERGRNAGMGYFAWYECDDDSDIYFFDGILEDIVATRWRDDGNYDYEFDLDRVYSFMQSFDFSDIHYSAHAWVVVLSYLLMDYRYLYL